MLALIFRILDVAGDFSPKARRSLILGMVFNVIKSFFMAFMLFAVFIVVENIGNITPEVIGQVIVVLVLSITGRFLFQWLVDIKMDAQGFDIFRDYRLRIGDRLKKAPMGYFSEQRLSAIQSTLTTTIHALEEFMTICLTGLSGGVAMAVIMTVFFAFFAWPIAIITLIGLVIGILVLSFLRRRSTAVTKGVLTAQERVIDRVMEYTRGMAVLRAFSKPDEALAEVEATFEEKRVADYQQEQAVAGIMKAYQLVFNLTSCAVLFATCVLYITGQISLSYCLMFLVAAFMVYGELIQMSDGAFLTKKIGNELDRIEEVCDIPEQDTSTAVLDPTRFDIELEHVSFSYDTRLIIDDVSLSVPQGTTCAIVGPSGSGKTTLCNLIARFWDVDMGKVLVGGHDVRDYTAESLLAHISMVFQNVYLFHDTIENNIAFGRPEATHEEVVTAAKRARCHDFIEALPQGYDTMVGEGGASLSGGERQRISIARAIMKDAPIVILDEATSSVDPENEHQLLTAIDELTHGKTLITIAHRLNTVVNADQIIVIDKGTIAQRGTHEQLSHQPGIYRSFLQLRNDAVGWQLGKVAQSVQVQ